MAANTQKNTSKPRGKADHLAMFRWKAGDPSPNPSGRPKKKPVTDRYKEVLEIELPEKALKKLGLQPGATYGDAIALRIAQVAIVHSKVEAAREIREAVEGKSIQQIEHTGNIIHEITMLEREKARQSLSKIRDLQNVIEVEPEKD